MSDILNEQVLVLNKSWVPIHIKTAKEAICDLVSECAKAINTSDEFLPLCTWEEWLNINPSENDRYIKASRDRKIKIPEIIVLSDYNSIPELEIRLTRKNLLLRDNCRCQYCGKKVTNKDFTIDHIIPKSRGGINSWENLVTACFPCNIKKRDRTPKEAGIVLRNKPVKPKWYPLASRYTHSSPVSWKKFLPEGKVPTLIN